MPADAATDDDGSSSPQLLLHEELEPLTAANLKGRAVLIPREYWSDEPCTEYGGDGWRGKIDKVDLQKRAVGVRQDAVFATGLSSTSCSRGGPCAERLSSSSVQLHYCSS